MDAIEFNSFLAGLRNGLGFTKSCHILRQSPKEFSAVLRNDAGLYKQAMEAITYAAKALLVNGNNLLQEMNLPEWKKNMARIQTFIYALTLWEDYATKDQITPKLIIESFMLYRDWDEAATSIGLTRIELNMYMFDNPDIGEYIKENEYLFKG